MHEEVLTPKARELFPLLARFKGFYLVGGTALALQIGHRVSVDFDMFSEKHLSSRALQDVKRIFSRYSVQVTYRTLGQINATIDRVKFTIFHFPYPTTEKFLVHQRVAIANRLEIAAMKAFAISQRLAYKDYVDWYFLLHDHHVTLHDVIACAKKKFGGDFNDRLFMGQLAFLGDVPLQDIDFLQKPVDRKTIEKFLEKAVKDFIAKI